MAIQRVAYSCQYKCGRRTVLRKSAMEAHERICLKNPEKRSCRTCKHYESYQDTSGERGDYWQVKICNHEQNYDVDEIRTYCEHHEAK